MAGPVVGEPDHLVTYRDVPGILAGFRHYPGQVTALAGGERRRPPLGEAPGADLRLARVDPGRLDLDQDLPTARGGPVDLRHPQHVYPAVLVVSHSLGHRRTSVAGVVRWRRTTPRAGLCPDHGSFAAGPEDQGPCALCPGWARLSLPRMRRRQGDSMTAPAPATSPVRARAVVDFSQRPMLVFWETTRACLLACRHCRASATAQAPPGELSTAEGRALIGQVAAFGRPYPILVLTGGDCLLRPDLFRLVDYAVSLGVPVCLSPSVTPRLDAAMTGRIARSGVRAVSVSLDGACAQTHDGVRGIAGHFENTIAAIGQLAGAGLTVQVHTTVMDGNADDLPGIAALVAQAGAHIWEVFFLVQVGRGTTAGPVSPAGHEDVCHFLYDASAYGFIVRTAEAPFFRRVVRARRAGAPAPGSALYRRLSAHLTELLGPGTGRPSARTAPTRDGKGIVFISHRGEVYPDRKSTRLNSSHLG